MSGSEPILPQRATPDAVTITSVEWLFEPYWPGERLMARMQDGRVTLTDAAAQPAGSEFAQVGGLLEAAIDADAAVIDGIWTSQPFVDGSASRPTFVAIDLVELDGQSLARVPYQERRRLLASVLQESRGVRITPAVRVPAQPWLEAWRRQGFTRYVAKHANSRYRPGEQVQDWLVVSAGSGGKPSPGGRLGRSRVKRRRIED